jgi:Mg/Co/Ni transporter MgtE
MSPTRRGQVAAALDDEELADLLEEMSEQDQIRLLAGLELERSADVVEEMQPDDAADLLAEMPPEQRERLLAAMEAVQAADLRRLLLYDATTAGGRRPRSPLSSPRTCRSRRCWPRSETLRCRLPRPRRCSSASRP